ncbi:hypothetical protein [Methylobacterium aerolatum]|uniref:DUF2336 domain-containing protein n=1 Tax=Methylobacterium aerolatum TaxID=418708 RepID=A0ABU0HYT8_9HYPH|nr:hypothetical protein [Methylobacterium aerolatum]MDQ0447496.1 hypothetical protein [Methylobacterium aerolatum]
MSRIEQLDLKPVVLRVQTDLFLRAPHRDRAARETFASLACGLIPTVDEDTARIVAEKLSSHSETPTAILDALLARGGAVRAAVLAGNRAFAERAASTPAEEPQPDLAMVPETLTGILASLPALQREALEDLSRDGRPEVDLSLAKNLDIALGGAPLRRLTDRARHSGELARALLARPDLAAADLAPLYLHADPARREVIAGAIEATAALRPCPPAPRGLGTTLATLSSKRNVPAFIQTLSAALGLRPDFVATVAEPDARYDLLALAMRAAGLQEEEAVFVFLTLNQGVARSTQRVTALVGLFRAVSRAAARDLLSAILDVILPERVGEHVPYHGPEAKPRPGIERIAAQRAPAPSRTIRSLREGG